MAFGVVRLTPDVFWRMSWKEYELTLRGFFEQQNAISERQQMNAQLTGYYAIKPYLRKGTTFEKFAGIEKHREKKPLPTKDEIERMVKKMGRFITPEGIGYN